MNPYSVMLSKIPFAVDWTCFAWKNVWKLFSPPPLPTCAQSTQMPFRYIFLCYQHSYVQIKDSAVPHKSGYLSNFWCNIVKHECCTWYKSFYRASAYLHTWTRSVQFFINSSSVSLLLISAQIFHQPKWTKTKKHTNYKHPKSNCVCRCVCVRAPFYIIWKTFAVTLFRLTLSAP